MKCIHRLMTVQVEDGKPDMKTLRPASVVDLLNALNALAVELSGGRRDTQICKIVVQLAQCVKTMIKTILRDEIDTQPDLDEIITTEE